MVSKSQVPTRIDCAFECLSSQRCVSYNYEEGNKARHECELNSETKESKPTNLTGKAGHSYYGTGRNVSNSCSSWEILLNVTFINTEPEPSGFLVSGLAQVAMATRLTMFQHVLFSSKVSYSFGISNPQGKSPVVAVALFQSTVIVQVFFFSYNFFLHSWGSLVEIPEALNLLQASLLDISYIANAGHLSKVKPYQSLKILIIILNTRYLVLVLHHLV